MQHRPNLVVATITRPAGPTGVHTHFNTFIPYARARGHEVTLVTPFSFARPIALPVYAVRRALTPVSPSLSVWWFERWHYWFLQRALRRVLTQQPDAVVYAQDPLSASAALEARSSTAQPIVMAAHFNVSTAEEWAGLAGLPRDGAVYRRIVARERQAFSRLDRVVYVSRFVQDAVERAHPHARLLPSVVVPNFVSAAAATSPVELQADLVTIGTLEPRKNHTFLLRVLAEARRLGRTLRLTLIGDGPLRSELARTATALGIGDHVRFLGAQPDARRFLPAHRVYVHSALMESFGMAIIEAMATGLPICAAPTGGIPDVFDNGCEGLYWDLGDPCDGARRLIGLLEDPEAYRRMAAAARARFHRTYECSRVAGRLLDFLTCPPDTGSIRGGPGGSRL
jgi:glycosyltransferase involved in cell wall biosynthesis